MTLFQISHMVLYISLLEMNKEEYCQTGQF